MLQRVVTSDAVLRHEGVPACQRCTTLTAFARTSPLPTFVPYKEFCGSAHGFVYKLGPSGIGYYQDVPHNIGSAERVTLCLDDCIPPTSSTWTSLDWRRPDLLPPPPPPPRHRAFHRRDLDGKRIRRRGPHQNVITPLGSGAPSPPRVRLPAPPTSPAFMWGLHLVKMGNRTSSF